ncbi:Ca-transporting ATPase [Ramaria rubella]|nr:Ca-transporting ATPase [Ramaria rubella]
MDIGTSYSERRTRRRESHTSRSVFENVARLFRASSDAHSPPRRSLSRTSSAGSDRRQPRTGSRTRSDGSDYALDDEESERWGYSSQEEDVASSDDLLEEGMDIASPSDIDYGSVPPSPVGSLPFLSGDPIFGDTRISVDELPRATSPPPPPGPPSRQKVHLADEDTTVRFLGQEIIGYRQRLWTLGSVITFGGLGLMGQWFPRVWLRWVAREKAFKKTNNGFVVVETLSRDIVVVHLTTLSYPYPISTVFPEATSPLPSIGHGVICENDIAAVDTRKGDDEPGDKLPSSLRLIDYRYVRFVLNPDTGLFATIRDWRDPMWKTIAGVEAGLTEAVRQQRSSLFGSNSIDIQGKSTIALLVDEIIHPFYVFQIASIILWSIDDYYYYAFCIALISILSVTTTLVETKKTIARMREMSRFSCSVGVLVDGAFQDLNSADLVPGDVINISYPELTLIPADLLLLSGDAIVNESMLTGESVPISKTPILDSDLSKWRETGEITGQTAKGYLYSGTRVIRIRGPAEGNPALAMVVRTGFNTTKGALIRSMLFPKPMGFKFYRDSIRFIGVLACIAGLGFLASAFQFIRLHVPWSTIVIRALDLITVVVPPALPATLSIGTSFSIARLRKAGVFCISPSRVNVGGKVNVVCFDKTGTLTEDGLDVLGVRCLERTGDLFGDLLSEVYDIPLASGKMSFLHALATCHSLKVIDGEVMGDPLDVKMFQFTDWILEEGRVGIGAPRRSEQKTSSERPIALVQTVVRPPGSGGFRLEDALRSGSRHAHFLELGVIRTFEFVSALRRMSVIVKRLKSSSMEIYVKGAPDNMNEICDPESFPRDYDDLLSYYTNRGFRVIAIAGKSIEGLSWLKAQRMKREQAESGLKFLGLIIFENKIKPGTTPAIQTLRAAHLGCRMVTGDNARTAISVARDCSILSQSAHVFCPTFLVGNASTPNAKLDWSSVDDESLKLDDYSLRPLPPPPHLVDDNEIAYSDYALVLTGDVFRWMINHAPLETLQRMLVKSQVFARMSPDEKHELVERLQSLGYVVAFCGDGANDCGALKAADVGLSLSEAEASVAAPFTSHTQDIGCMIEVIKEGRAALVTSFSCFKYMALYSLIQFTTITLLYSFASSLGDFQFLYIDLFIIIPIAVTMGRTLPFSRIHPKRPTASLVSKKVLTSIIGQVLITSGVQFWTFFWVRSRSWYEPPNPDSGSDKLETTNFENTTLFLVSSFQYILVAAVFSIGPPYRQPMWSNGLLIFCISVLSAFSGLLLLWPPQALAVWLNLMTIPVDTRIELLAVVGINVCVSLGFEKWCQEIVAKLVGKIMGGRRRGRRVNGKVYKAVESVY